MLSTLICRNIEIEMIELNQVTVRNKPFSGFSFQFFGYAKNLLSGHCTVAA